MENQKYTICTEEDIKGLHDNNGIIDENEPIELSPVVTCKHDLQPIYNSYSNNFQELEGYRCSKCGAIFRTNCISLANSV